MGEQTQKKNYRGQGAAPTRVQFMPRPVAWMSMQHPARNVAFTVT